MKDRSQKGFGSAAWRPIKHFRVAIAVVTIIGLTIGDAQFIECAPASMGVGVLSALKIIAPNVTVTADSIAELRTLDRGSLIKSVQVLGYYSAGDGGGGPMRIWKDGAAAGTYIDNGGSVIVPTGGDGSAAWVWEKHTPVLAADYGWSTSETAAVNTTAIQNAINDSGAYGSKVIDLGTGSYLVNHFSIDNTASPAVTQLELLGHSRPLVNTVPAVDGATKLVFGGTNGSILDITGSAADPQQGIEVKGVIFDGADNAEEGVQLSYVSRGATLDECGFTRIKNGNGRAVSISNSFSGVISDCYWADNNTDVYIGDASDSWRIVRPYARTQDYFLQVYAPTTSSDQISVLNGDIAGFTATTGRFAKIDGCRIFNVIGDYIEQPTGSAIDEMFELGTTSNVGVANISGNYFQLSSELINLIKPVDLDVLNFTDNQVTNLNNSSYVINGMSGINKYRSIWLGNDLGAHTSNFVDDATQLYKFALFQGNNLLTVNKARVSPEKANVSVSSGTITLDCSTYSYFNVNLTENVTNIVMTGAEANQEITIKFTQDATGGWTVAGWPAGTKEAWSDTGNSANKTSTIKLFLDSNWIQDGAQSPYM